MALVQYSVLSYSPSILTNESINLGVFFCLIDEQKCEFLHTSNWTRVSSFDDELSLAFLRDFLKDIKLELNGHCDNLSSRQSFIARFVNEFKFSKPVSINASNADEFISDTLKVQLRYDEDKDKRFTAEQQKDYAKKYLKSLNIKYKTSSLAGRYNEPISFDYVVDEHAFKHFEFRSKQVQSMYASVHSWRDIAREVRDMYKPIFVYDINEEEAKSESYYKIIEMLKDSDAQVVSMSSAIRIINNFTSHSVRGSQISISERL